MILLARSVNNRRDAGWMIRDWLGDRLIRHDQWGSRFAWSRHFDSSPFGRRRFVVGHHNGASAQLPRIQANIARGMSPVDAEIVQIRQVDKWHKVDRGWPRGFAYCLMPGPFSGHIFEGRSAWVTHGAHMGDPGRLDFPVYQAIGAADPAMTSLQEQGWRLIVQMLEELTEVVADPDTLKLHREVQGWNSTQCCDPTFGNFIRAHREGTLSPPSPTPPPSSPLRVRPSAAIIDWVFASGLATGDPSYWKTLPAEDPQWSRLIEVIQRGMIGWAFDHGHAAGDAAYWLSLDPRSGEWSDLFSAVTAPPEIR